MRLKYTANDQKIISSDSISAVALDMSQFLQTVSVKKSIQL